MKKFSSEIVVPGIMSGSVGLANAGRDSHTTALFQKSHQSSECFDKSYGYAVFSTITKGGAGIGDAHGTGNLYTHGRRLGHVTSADRVLTGWIPGQLHGGKK